MHIALNNNNNAGHVMASSTEKRKPPLSPHLQVYKPQITSILSVLHRGTGIILYFGTLLLVCWLACLAAGPIPYHEMLEWLKSPLGAIILMGLSFSFYYHLANGIRHLAWDLGYGYDLQTVTKTGWLVVATAIIFSGFTWVLGYIWGGFWS